jgi:hypothetical protein
VNEIRQKAAAVAAAHAEMDAVSGRREDHAEFKSRFQLLLSDPPESTEDLLRALFPRSGRSRWDAIRADPRYQDALKRFSTALNDLYSPAFYDATARLKAGDVTESETGIRFLEADPWCFRSGYMKSNIARYLRSVRMVERDKDRLRQVLLDVVKVGKRLEFREMCSLARKVDSPAFRGQLLALSESNDVGTAQRAGWMLEYCRFNDRGYR